MLVNTIRTMGHAKIQELARQSTRRENFPFDMAEKYAGLGLLG